MASVEEPFIVPSTSHSPTILDLNRLQLLLILTLLIPALCILYLDYQKFLSLGPGGTPSTIPGYLRVKVLGLFALRDPFAPPKIPPFVSQREGCLTTLPIRSGPRPSTMGIAPHRQTSHRASPELFARLSAALLATAAQNAHISVGTSCFEKHGTGLFSTCPQRRTCRGEICHAHPSDGSMHLTLHPADAKTMLEAGWGVRHPLARGGWLERFVPGGFVMVYAPRDEADLDIILDIVQAAAWWVGGRSIDKPDLTIRRDSVLDLAAIERDREAGCHACISEHTSAIGI